MDQEAKQKSAACTQFGDDIQESFQHIKQKNAFSHISDLERCGYLYAIDRYKGEVMLQDLKVVDRDRKDLPTPQSDNLGRGGESLSRNMNEEVRKRAMSFQDVGIISLLLQWRKGEWYYWFR